MPIWTWLTPIAAAAVLAAAGVIGLIVPVIVAVHHAEVVAHRVGEPFGSLVLAVAVTIIEVALIVSMMLSSATPATALARDTVFAAVMIVSTGVVGLFLLVRGLPHHVIACRVEGTSPALAPLTALITLTLVLPAYTTSTAGPTFSTSQLVFAGVVSLALYGVFLFVQTVRHRDYFLPADPGNEAMHAAAVSASTALL